MADLYTGPGDGLVGGGIGPDGMADERAAQLPGTSSAPGGVINATSSLYGHSAGGVEGILSEPFDPGWPFPPSDPLPLPSGWGRLFPTSDDPVGAVGGFWPPIPDSPPPRPPPIVLPPWPRVDSDVWDDVAVWLARGFNSPLSGSSADKSFKSSVLDEVLVTLTWAISAYGFPPDDVAQPYFGCQIDLSKMLVEWSRRLGPVLRPIIAKAAADSMMVENRLRKK